MDRINKIFAHPLYKQAYEKIVFYEKDRIYCGHDLGHFLSVARLAYIKILEENKKIEKEIVYAGALLHDIGRCKEYEEKIPHDIASANLARDILLDCAFSIEEIDEIVTAIQGHRGFNSDEEKVANDLSTILKWADKKSRNCMVCPARCSCKWSEEKKNKILLG